MAVALPGYTPMFKRPQGRKISPLAGASVQTSDVLGAGVKEGFMGATSLAANIESYLVERDTGRQQNAFSYGLGAFVFNTGNFVESLFGGGETEADRQPLSREEWVESEFYREGIEYKPGLTVRSAKVLQQAHDREEAKNFLLSQASGWQSAGFFASALVSSVVDAKNIAVGGAAGAAVKSGVAAYSGFNALKASGVAGVATKSVLAGRSARATTAIGSSLVRANNAAVQSLKGFKYGKRALVAESALGAGIMGATGFEAEQVLGRQYGLEDIALDFVASSVISIGLNSIGGYIGAMWLKTSHTSDIDAISNLAATQMQNGERLDVRVAAEAQLAERYIPLSTLHPDKRRASVSQIGRKKQYEAVYEGEQGIYGAVKGRGNTPEEAIADLEDIYATGRVGNDEFNQAYTPEYYREALAVQDLKEQVASFDMDAQEAIEFKNLSGEDIDAAFKRVRELKKQADNIAKTRGKRKAERAQKKYEAEKQKLDEMVSTAANNVNDRFSALKKTHQAAADELVKRQKELHQPLLVEWTKKQLDADPRGRIGGVDRDNADYQSYVDEANRAPNGPAAVSSADEGGEIAALELMMNDDNIGADFKALIKERLDDVGTAKKIPEAYRNYIACVTGGA